MRRLLLGFLLLFFGLAALAQSPPPAAVPNLAGKVELVEGEVTVFDKAKKARLELVELAKRSNWDPGPGFKWNREELYDREALRRHERSDLRGVDEVKGKRKET